MERVDIQHRRGGGIKAGCEGCFENSRRTDIVSLLENNMMSGCVSMPKEKRHILSIETEGICCSSESIEEASAIFLGEREADDPKKRIKACRRAHPFPQQIALAYKI